MSKEALVKQSPAALAEVPEYLRSQMGNRAGLEEVGREDVLIPRLCVAQDGTPQRKKSNEAYIQGLEVGQLFNSVTGEIYGAAVNVVPLFYFKQFIHFHPIDDGGGIVAQYATAEDVPAGGLNFGPNGEKPVVTEFKNWMSLLIHEDGRVEPIVCSFKSSGLKTVKKWNSLIRLTPLMAYARVYELRTVTQSNGQQEWEGVHVTPGPFVPQELFQQAEMYFNELRGAGVKVDTTGLDVEREPGSDDETKF